MIRTKIIATIGPACADPETLFRLFQAGADVCRLNFSHGDLDAHMAALGNIRSATQRHGHPVAILGDLGGPKIRVGAIADAGAGGSGGMAINVGDELVIQRQPVIGATRRISTNYPAFVDDVQVGHRILIEDGLLRFVCIDKSADEIRATCLAGGILKSGKGINLPNTSINLPCITERDWQCIQWAIANELDYLALSFIRTADDLHELRHHLHEQQSDIELIAKIEKAEAVSNIDAILEACDGLMVARGDLGVEMELARVPIIQKELIRRCQSFGKPVIVATQMLQSMIEQASPTRAEVSDVANAIFDGTDAIMLSGETSVGKFPVGVVHTMAHIAQTTEEYLISTHADGQPEPRLKTTHPAIALARGAWPLVQDLEAKLVVIWSQSGTTARIFSKSRFPIPIIALSTDPRALRRMALHFGVIPQQMPQPSSMIDFIEKVDKLLLASSFATRGERAIIACGSSMGIPQTMNGLFIHTLGDPWTTPVLPSEPTRGVGEEVTT